MVSLLNLFWKMCPECLEPFIASGLRPLQICLYCFNSPKEAKEQYIQAAKRGNVGLTLYRAMKWYSEAELVNAAQCAILEEGL